MVRRSSGAVGEALAALPERQRRALLLREWRKLSYAEIADELGVPPAAVGPLLYRARRTLAERL
jgi:RNA polymerase sigma-70 factor (ECF subfamily)